MLYVFNTNIIPDEAVVRVQKISPETATEILRDAYALGNSGGTPGFVSAIGHDATAQVLSTLTGVEVPVNRIQAAPEAGDRAVSLKINGRLPEGQILTVEAMQEIGFQFFLIEFFSTEMSILPPVGG